MTDQAIDASAAPAAAPEAGTVWYVYGIQRAVDGFPAEATGVIGSAVEPVEAAGLRAIASRVPAAEMGENALQENLEDLKWLAVNARDHEAVLLAAMREGPILPIRFGAVFRTSESIERILEGHRAALHDELDRIVGCSEWGAKLLVDIEECDAWIASQDGAAASRTSPAAAASRTSPAAAARSGRSYLKEKQAERARRAARATLLRDVAAECHDELSAVSLDSRSNPPHDAELSGSAAPMILNGVYLLDDASVGRFHEIAGAFADRGTPMGLRLQITGPWPAHHFVTLPLDPGIRVAQ